MNRSRRYLLGALVLILISGGGLLVWWHSSDPPSPLENTLASNREAMISRDTTSVNGSPSPDSGELNHSSSALASPAEGTLSEALPMASGSLGGQGEATATLATQPAESRTAGALAGSPAAPKRAGEQSPDNALPGAGKSGRTEWLAEQPSENFTVQLMVSSQEDNLRKLIREKRLTAPLAIARFSQEGRALHLLLMGSYPSRKVAEHVAQELQKHSGVEPWVRSFASLPPLSGEEVITTVALENYRLGGAAWLWSRNPEHFTMQLLGASTRQGIESYLQSHPVAGDLALLKLQRGGKPWFLLLCGEYGSSDEARRALAELPANTKVVSPWNRTFASLQDEMMNPGR